MSILIRATSAIKPVDQHERSVEREPSNLFSEIWREAPIDETDPEAVHERDMLRAAIFGVFFGDIDKETGERPRLPFSELPREAIDLMPPGLRGQYESEQAAAQDPRSGPRLDKSTQIYPAPDMVE